MAEKHDPQTKRVRYLYLDVVEFTRDRSIEAQSDIVESLNVIVLEAVSDQGLEPKDIMYLPTGDGLGIAILDEAASFDIHIQLALRILTGVHDHNQVVEDPMRQFEVRIGANENVDNVITDINGNQNVAGAGINMAQRVMSLADNQQLLVGQMVFETLSYRERYMNAFMSYQASIKHGITIPVHQFIEDGHVGLSTHPPTVFSPPIPKERRLTELEAYYLAFAIQYQEFLLKNSGHGQSNYALVVLLWFLTQDAVRVAHATDYNPASPKIVGGGKASVEECFKYYMSIEFWVCAELADFIRNNLSGVSPYLESVSTAYYVVNENGRRKLCQDYPDIWKALDLGDGT